MSVNISKVEVFSFKNQKITFDHYKGNVLLIVNVASKCGFTKQYKALQYLQDKYESKGFKVLGFPCNDFGNQEPGQLEEIKEFCSASMANPLAYKTVPDPKGEGCGINPSDVLSTPISNSVNIQGNFV